MIRVVEGVKWGSTLNVIHSEADHGLRSNWDHDPANLNDNVKRHRYDGLPIQIYPSVSRKLKIGNLQCMVSQFLCHNR